MWLAVALVALAAGMGLGAYTQLGAFSYRDLLTALAARGASVQESGTASTLTFRGAGHGLMVNGAQVAAYEYGTAIAAQLDAARVSPDGATFGGGFGPFGGSAVTVDWIAPPHHYRRGRVIVTYVGVDAGIARLLTSVLGPQFAGGATPTGDGFAWFAERLRSAGATVHLVRHRFTTPILLGTAPAADEHVIAIDGTVVSVYEFADDQAAALNASHVIGGDYIDPQHHRFLHVDYWAPPHFFRHDALVAVHVGTDPGILRLLRSVLGPPFTEGHV
jgi:hypothetical protein